MVFPMVSLNRYERFQDGNRCIRSGGCMLRAVKGDAPQEVALYAVPLIFLVSAVSISRTFATHGCRLVDSTGRALFGFGTKIVLWDIELIGRYPAPLFSFSQPLPPHVLQGSIIIQVANSTPGRLSGPMPHSDNILSPLTQRPSSATLRSQKHRLEAADNATNRHVPLSTYIWTGLGREKIIGRPNKPECGRHERHSVHVLRHRDRTPH